MSQKHYELMVILTPVLSQEEYKSSEQSIINHITSLGATIIGNDAWGLKTLAYPINKKTTGLFIVTEYATEAPINSKLETILNRDENVLRYMLTHLDKHAIAYNDRKRKGIKVEPKVKSTVNETE